jgi:hypothetical protein
MEIFVNGTLMRGLALHENLAGCKLVREDETAEEYALFALGGGTYPGMIHVGPGSGAIRVPGEVYDVPDARLLELLAKEPPHLYLGAVRMQSGETLQGVLCEEAAARAAPSISHFGGWRAYAATARPREQAG